MRASDCHISLIGHITSTELNRLLSANDAANGFANRILWVKSQRVRRLPDGGDIQSEDFSKEVRTLCQIVELTQGLGELKRSPEAKDYWHYLYNELSRDDVPGVWGQVTSRAEAQVVRLSLVIALMDLSERINVEHLKAAEAVWKYCFESARDIFGERRYSHEGKRLLESLQSSSLTMTQISHDVFNKHLHGARLNAVMDEIKNEITTQKIDTGGKPVTLVSLRNPVEL
jgi:DNA replicative helicase MCM subunit Mcm2 (Cdc46/Mcm family)